MEVEEGNEVNVVVCNDFGERGRGGEVYMGTHSWYSSTDGEHEAVGSHPHKMVEPAAAASASKTTKTAFVLFGEATLAELTDTTTCACKAVQLTCSARAQIMTSPLFGCLVACSHR